MNKEKICVYTCITGNYDNVNEIKQEDGIDYYLFTNNKKIKSNTWKVVYIEDESLSNVVLARKIKILGHPIINDKYDIIITNPPYIPYDGYVQDIVKNNEPSIALFASDEGLYFYKKILSYAFKHLNKNGFIALEIGDKQKDLLEEYLENNFSSKKWHFEKDLAGLERYLFIFNE